MNELTPHPTPLPLPAMPSTSYWEHLLTEALPATAIYSLAGILLALMAFRLLDWLTPGDLNKKIFEEGNIAAAILGAALVLGICAIIVASIAG
jgi:putative membrane protein